MILWKQLAKTTLLHNINKLDITTLNKIWLI